jgi:ribonuclease HI
MKNTAPHYLLITEAKTIIDSREEGRATPRRSGQWRFVLEQMGVEARIEVADEEPNVFGERLELLAVVRGLESLEQSSRVTLLTDSRYVGRGIRQGMNQWRSNQWRWERFGRMTLIKNHDLWRRVDRTLQFHSLECRILDLGRLTSHVTAASTSLAQDQTHAVTKSRIDSPHRRSNVIRPHGDRVATIRKPIEPQPFADAGTIRVSSKAAEPTDELKNSNITPNFKRQEIVKSGCNVLQSRQVSHKRETMALVKPPRAGRAYGYAVN